MSRSSHGAIALSLANTLASDRTGRDLLSTTGDARSWLASETREIGDVARADLDRLRHLRAAIRQLLDDVVEGRSLSQPARGVLNTAAAAGSRTLALETQGSDVRVAELRISATPLDALLGEVAESAILLLGASERQQIGRCMGPGCLRYFAAAHPARKWCSSTVCGNRVRVARYARRTNEARPTPQTRPISPGGSHL